MTQDYTILSVQKALKILTLFSKDSQEMSLTQISAEMGLGRSSTLRLLYTLQQEGFVSYDEERKKYSLGLELFQLGMIKYDQLNWRKIAVSNLLKLSNETGLICYLGVREQDRLVMLEKIFPSSVPSWAQLMVQSGKTLPLHSTGIGRLFLAQMSDEQIKAYLKDVKLQKSTTNTVTDKEKLLELIYSAAREKAAFNIGENEEYIDAICAPLYDINGIMIAGISLSGIHDIIYGERRPYLIEALKRTAAEISKEIGYLGG